ncbi:hypothetical protein BASA81_003156 [Batrachochytrium salamandrivorans]|nr:hypothetical protein BASA81_003156 [Batrachochytrium salamandrivorans]
MEDSENDLERTLEAEDILGLFDMNSPSSHKLAKQPAPSSSCLGGEETVNPSDFSAMLNQMASPVPPPSSMPPPPLPRLSNTATPSPRLTPSFFSSSSATQLSSSGGVAAAFKPPKRAPRETLNPNSLPFITDLISKPSNCPATTVTTSSSLLFNQDDVTVFPSDDLFHAKSSSPPQTPSTSFFPTTSVIVPKSILRTQHSVHKKKFASVQFGRTKSVLRFDNQFPVDKLKQEDGTAVQTPGKHLQMKEICEEEMLDEEDGEFNKRLNFKEDGEEDEEMDEDEFERELFRNSWSQTEKSSSASSLSSLPFEMDSFTGEEDARRQTLAVPSIGDFTDSTESFLMTGGRDSLDVPALSEFRREEDLTVGPKASPPRLQQRRPSSLLEDEEDVKNGDERRQTLDVPSIAQFRRESLVNIPEGNEDLSVVDDHSLLSVGEGQDGRRQTLDVPSLMDFKRESLGGEYTMQTIPEHASPSSSSLSPSSPGEGLLGQTPSFISERGEGQRRLTLDVPSFMDFRRNSIATVTGGNYVDRRQTLDVPSILDFKRDSIVGGGFIPQQGEEDSLLMASTNLPDLARGSNLHNDHHSPTPVPSSREEDKTLAVPQVLDFAVQQEQVSAFLSSSPIPTAPVSTSISHANAVDELLRHFYPSATAVAVAPTARKPSGGGEEEDLGSFVQDAIVDHDRLVEALVNVHYTDNCLDFVENQLYQVATQRRSMLDDDSQTAAAAAQMLASHPPAKLKKQMKLARLEAERELGEWEIQIGSEYLRSLQNQTSRVREDLDDVLLVEHIKAQQHVAALTSELEARRTGLQRAQQIAELRKRIRLGEDELLGLETDLGQVHDKLSASQQRVEILTLERDMQAKSTQKLHECETQIELAKLKLLLQQSFSSWELQRATASSAEISFEGFSLLVEVHDSGDESGNGAKPYLKLRVQQGQPSAYVVELMRNRPVQSLFDLVHFLTLVEEHVSRGI